MGTHYIGLDIHKVSISVSIAEDGRDGAVRFLGEIPNTPTDVGKLAKRLARGAERLEFCYEAGCCGYGVYRQLTELGHGCMVVAPSLIPRKSGERVKTDRRDAQKLAILHRSGDLTRVWVPDPVHEAMRDLVRARLDAMMALSERASSCCRSYFGTAGLTRRANIGLNAIACGWLSRCSSSRCIRSSSRTTSRRSGRRRNDATI